jgi:hypothetical protein
MARRRYLVSEDGGTNWKVTRLTKGKMDDWAANDPHFAKMIWRLVCIWPGPGPYRSS